MSTLTSHTPMSKIWQRVRKIRGIYGKYRPPSLHINGILEQDPQVVANTMASHVATVSSNTSYPRELLAFKARR